MRTTITFQEQVKAFVSEYAEQHKCSFSHAVNVLLLSAIEQQDTKKQITKDNIQRILKNQEEIYKLLKKVVKSSPLL